MSTMNPTSTMNPLSTTGIHVLSLGRQKLVCGLFWQSLSRPRELAQEARALARKIDADLLVLRKDQTMAQAGYAHTRDGARAGHASFACLVASRLAEVAAFGNGQRQGPHNWLGAFRLPDGMWAYLAVRDANFLPSGDLAGTREQVLERLHGDYALGGWNRVVGEPELEQQGFHDFLPLGLEALLAPGARQGLKAPRWSRLETVQQPWRRYALPGAAVLALGLALAAAGLYQRHSAQQLRLVQERAMLALRQPAPPAPPPEPPWHTQAPADDLVRRCLAHLRHLAPGGWRLDQFQCSAGEAVHTWRRGESHLGLLLAALPQALPDASGEQATLAEPLAPGVPRAEPLAPLAVTRRALQELWQRLGLAGQVVERPAPPPVPGPDGALPAAPPWSTYTVSVSLDRLAPQALPAMLAQPGLRLEKITYRAGIWSLEGVLYAN